MTEYEWAVFNRLRSEEPVAGGMSEDQARRTAAEWERSFGELYGPYYVARRPLPVMPLWERVS